MKTEQFKRCTNERIRLHEEAEKYNQDLQCYAIRNKDKVEIVVREDKIILKEGDVEKEFMAWEYDDESFLEYLRISGFKVRREHELKNDEKIVFVKTIIRGDTERGYVAERFDDIPKRLYCATIKKMMLTAMGRYIDNMPVIYGGEKFNLIPKIEWIVLVNKKETFFENLKDVISAVDKAVEDEN